MNIGDYIETPRFLTVKIEDVLTSSEAQDAGYTEPTHYCDVNYHILGKSIGENRMIFAAVHKPYKVISKYYDTGTVSSHIDVANPDEQSYCVEGEGYDHYVDVFDSYGEASAFYEDCRSEDGRKHEV